MNLPANPQEGDRVDAGQRMLEWRSGRWILVAESGTLIPGPAGPAGDTGGSGAPGPSAVSANPNNLLALDNADNLPVLLAADIAPAVIGAQPVLPQPTFDYALLVYTEAQGWSTFGNLATLEEQDSQLRNEVVRIDGQISQAFLEIQTHASSTHLTLGDTGDTAAPGNHPHTNLEFMITDAAGVAQNAESMASGAMADVAAHVNQVTHLTLGSTSDTAAAGNHPHSEYQPTLPAPYHWERSSGSGAWDKPVGDYRYAVITLIGGGGGGGAGKGSGASGTGYSGGAGGGAGGWTQVIMPWNLLPASLSWSVGAGGAGGATAGGTAGGASKLGNWRAGGGGGGAVGATGAAGGGAAGQGGVAGGSGGGGAVGAVGTTAAIGAGFAPGGGGGGGGIATAPTAYRGGAGRGAAYYVLTDGADAQLIVAGNYGDIGLAGNPGGASTLAAPFLDAGGGGAGGGGSSLAAVGGAGGAGGWPGGGGGGGGSALAPYAGGSGGTGGAGRVAIDAF